MAAVEVCELPGRGRSVKLQRNADAGACVLSEAPVLLTVAPAAINHVCAQCLRRLPRPGHLLCAETQQACFCSPECLAAAETVPGSPGLTMRRSLARLPRQALTEEQLMAARLVLQVLALHAAASADRGDCAVAARIAAINELRFHRGAVSDADVGAVHAAVEAVVGRSVPVADVHALMCKDACNSYGITAAPSDDNSIRGSALYRLASCLNHECVPNAARKEDFDEDGPERTHMRVCTLHELPAGEEVVISYFPLSWAFTERQERCRSLYGFDCLCPRCKCEKSWNIEEELGMPSMSSAAEEQQAVPAASGHDDGREALDPTYLQIFLLKYVCAECQCTGTYVPVQGDCERRCICNRCGSTRTEIQFLQDLESEMEAT